MAETSPKRTVLASLKKLDNGGDTGADSARDEEEQQPKRITAEHGASTGRWPGSVVIGVDPGSVNAGLAALAWRDGRIQLLVSRTIRFTADTPHEDRLYELHNTVADWIATHEPVACGIETPVYGSNPSSMLKLGRAQAAAILAARIHRIPILEFMPKAIKKAITGNGNATKDQVAYMLRTFLPDAQLPSSKDETDAIAAGVCALHHLGTTRRLQPGAETNRKGANTWARYVRENPERVHASGISADRHDQDGGIR